MKRRAMGRREANRQFRKGANKVHKANLMTSVSAPYVMRGGIRK